MITVAFDIDGTLIYPEGVPNHLADTPRYDIINFLLFLQKIGCEIVIWSGGGTEYAVHWIYKLGLDNCRVAEKGSLEPDIAVDDEEVKLGKVNIKVNL